MKSIIFFTHSTPFHPGTILTRGLGGSESALIHLSRKLARLGHSVRVFCACDAPGEYEGVVYREAAELPAHLADKEVDLFVSLRIPQVFTGTIPAKLKWLWAEDSFDQPHIQCLMDPSLTGRIDRIVTVSRWQAETYRRHFKIPEEKFFVSRNGFHPPFFEGPLPESRPPRLAYASTPFRGLDVLLDLFPKIRAEVPETELYIFSSMAVYGVSREEDEREYGDLYRKAGQPGVKRVGSIPQDRLAKELMQASLLAYPNHFAETSCIAAIEAQAAGTPVVTTRLGGLVETVADGKTGILIPGDSRTKEYGERFVREIIRLLKDENAWRKLSRNARERAFREYRWEDVAKEWSRAIEEQLHNRKEVLIAGTPEGQAGTRQIGGFQSRVLACQKKIQQNPEDPEPYNRLGLLYRDAGEPAKALEAFRKAIAHYVLYNEAYENYRSVAEELGIPIIRNDLDIVFYTVGNFTPADLGKKAVGGSETALMAIARELSRLGRRVIVFNSTQEVSFHDGVEYRNLVDFFLLNHWNRTPFFISSRVPMPFRAGLNAGRTIFWVHDDCLADYIREENLSDLPVDTIFTVSRWQAEAYAEHFGIPRDRFHVTRNGIDLTFFPREPLSRDRKKLVYTSRPDRGLDVLLDLFPKIREKEPEAELHIFTYTQAESLETDPEMIPVLPKVDQPGVILRGGVPKEVLYRELATARLLVYPSIWRETSCIAVLEAQAAGLPVITTSLAALPESVAGGILISGNPYHPDYQSRFVREVLRLMKDDTAWRELSGKGREFVMRRHTWKTIGSEWNRYLSDGARRPLLSLCMIAKNEEEMLPRCLDSVRSIVDEIIIVDTGSTDRTVEIAESFGAKVIRHPWRDDFSEARNVSIDHAAGEWILVLDADERIAGKDVAKIAATIRDPDLFACFLTQRTYTDNTSLLHWQRNQQEGPEGKDHAGYVDSELIRLFRRDPKIHFRNPVHELVEPAVAEAGLKTIRTGIPIHHYGKVRGEAKLRAKGTLYERIGQEKIREAPRDPKAIFELAAQKVELKQFAEAEQLFKEVTRIRPDSDEAWLNLGSVLLEQDRPGEALEAYRSAQRINPENTDIEYNLGVAEQRLERHDEAIRHFEKAIALKPDSFLAYWSLGYSELAREDYDTAEQHFKESIRIHSGFASPHNDLGVLYARTGRMELAAGQFEEALAIDPENVETRRNLEQARLHTGKTEEKTGRTSPTLSLCMIVKNEEFDLPRCLDSVREFVDEIILVDTGSTDRTVEVARRYTDRIYHHPWENHFSKARNQSLRYAHGDWILILDADEWFEPGEGTQVREAILNAGNQVTHIYLDRWNLSPDGRVNTVLSLPRLFRNGRGLCFEGRIHEQLHLEGEGRHGGIRLLHDGYCRGGEKEREKFERNRGLIEREIQADPGNPFHYHNLCLALQGLDKTDDAVRAGMQAIETVRKVNPKPRYILQTCYTVSALLFGQGKIEEARDLAVEATGIDPTHPDAWYLLALIASVHGPWKECIRTGSEYLTILEERSAQPVIEPVPVYTLGRRHTVTAMIGGAHYRLGDPVEGDAWILKAIELGAHDHAFLRSVGSFYEAVGEKEKAAVIFEGLEEPETEGNRTGESAPRLSLCMITKDEEELLPGCLESIRGLVDEIVIIDTGSTDRTVKIAESFGARVIRHPWKEDFSEARNRSIEEANGEWILVLDADERIERKDHDTIRRRIADPGAKAFQLLQRNYTDDSTTFGWTRNLTDAVEGRDFSGYFDVPLARLFRRDPKIRFVNRVHERVEETLEKFGWEFPLLPVPIHHLGKARGDDFVRRKLETYLTISRKKLEANPDDVRALYEIGGTLIELGRPGEAIPILEKGMKIDPAWKGIRILRAIAGINTGDEAGAGEALSPFSGEDKDPQILQLRAICALRLGQWEKAAEAFEKALVLDPESFRYRIGLSQALIRMGKTGEALNLLEEAQAIAPRSPEVQNDLGCLLLLKEKRKEAEEHFERALQLDAGFREAKYNLSRIRNSEEEPGSTERNRRATLSVCMMVRDEEEMLEHCLDSIRDHVDEIVIVDTGSTDRTVEIARRYTDRVYHHPWENDFSKARNQSLRYATSDWILILDADEQVDTKDAPRLREIIQDRPGNITHLFMEVLNYHRNGSINAVLHSPRIFRNGIGFHYEGRVHNQPKITGEGARTGLRIHHQGYALNAEKMEAKARRTIPLLKEEIRRDPDNPWHRHNLCVSYSMAKRDGEAIEEGLKARELAEKLGIFPPYLFYSQYVVASLFCAEGEYEKAIQTAEHCLEKNPDHFDSCYVIALSAYQQDHFEVVREMGERYLTLLDRSEQGQDEPDIPAGTAGFRPRMEKMLGHAYFALGQEEKAEETFRSYLDHDRNHPDRYREIGLFYHGNNRGTEARRLYRQHLNEHPDDTFILKAVADTYTREEKFMKARELYERVLSLDPHDPEARYLKDCAEERISPAPRDTATGTDPGNLESRFEEILAAEPDNPAALRGLALTLLAAGDRDRAEEILRHILEIDETDPEVLSFLTALYLEQGRLDASLLCCEALLGVLSLPTDRQLNTREDLADLMEEIGSNLEARDQTTAAAEIRRVSLNLRNEVHPQTEKPTILKI